MRTSFGEPPGFDCQWSSVAFARMYDLRFITIHPGASETPGAGPEIRAFEKFAPSFGVGSPPNPKRN